MSSGEDRYPPNSVKPSDNTYSVDHFTRFPTGGTVYFITPPPHPSVVNTVSLRFRKMPNGGGTVFERDGGGDEGDE